MKLIIIAIINVVLVESTLHAGDLMDFSITTNQAFQIRQQLNSYDQGTISLKELGEKASKDKWRQIIGYYLLHSNSVSEKCKLPIARCYAQFHKISEATRLGEEYINVYSNDWRGWRLLGYCYFAVNSNEKAMHAYQRAAELGDKESYEPLAGIAIQNRDWDVVR